MIHSKDFAIKIDYDAEGPLVSVTHTPTGIQRTARPVSGQSVGKVRDELLEEVRGAIYNPMDFTIDYLLCGIDGKFECRHRLTHRPTGKSRSLDGHDFQDMLDELVTELWQEGIRA